MVVILVEEGALVAFVLKDTIETSEELSVENAVGSGLLLNSDVVEVTLLGSAVSLTFGLVVAVCVDTKVRFVDKLRLVLTGRKLDVVAEILMLVGRLVALPLIVAVVAFSHCVGRETVALADVTTGIVYKTVDVSFVPFWREAVVLRLLPVGVARVEFTDVVVPLAGMSGTLASLAVALLDGYPRTAISASPTLMVDQLTESTVKRSEVTPSLLADIDRVEPSFGRLPTACEDPSLNVNVPDKI